MLWTRVLDEACLRVMEDLRKKRFRFHTSMTALMEEVFGVDVGNKRVGVSTLQELLGVRAESCIHVGDQMYETGNDIAESCCNYLVNPTETKYIESHAKLHWASKFTSQQDTMRSLTKSKHRRKVPKFNFL